MHINCKLAGYGWIYIDIVTGTPEQAEPIKTALAHHLVVFQYDRRNYCYKSSFYDFDNLLYVCDKLHIEVRASKQFQKILFKYERRFKKCKNAYKDTSFDIPFWKKDKNVKPLKYQLQAINSIVESKKMLLGDDMGVGKSPQGIGVILKSFKKYGFTRAVILAPSSLLMQWKDEFEKFTNYPQDKILVIDKHMCKKGILEDGYNGNYCKGVKYKKIPQCEFYKECKKEKESFDYYRKIQISTADILLINYEKLDKYKDFIIKQRFDVFILDEAKEIKNPRSKKSLACAEIIEASPHSVAVPMSATFIENQMRDLYSAMNVIDKKIFGTYSSFVSKFLVVDHHNNVVGVQRAKVKKLKKIVNRHMIRRTLDEVWKERPSIVQQIRYCTMSKEQQKLYDSVRNQELKDIGEKELQKSVNQAKIEVLIAKLLMITDTIKSVIPDTKAKEHSGKFDELKKILLDELPEDKQVTIFSRFGGKVVPHLVDELQKTFGKNNVNCITGEVNSSQKQRNKVVKKFRKGDFKILVCSDALAYGANLQHCHYIINLDLPWNPAVLWQRIGRVYRRGQNKSVTVINLMIKDTFEIHLYNVLLEKKELSKTILKESEMQKSQTQNNVNLKNLIEHL